MRIIHQKIKVIIEAFMVVFGEAKYGILAATIAVIMAFTYPLLFPIAVGAKKISLFAFRASLGDIFVLTLISMLVGIIGAMQLYKFKRITKEYKKTGVHVISTSLGLITSKACCLLPLLLLSLGATAGIAFFIKYTTEVRLVGLMILSLSLYWTSLDIVENTCCR